MLDVVVFLSYRPMSNMMRSFSFVALAAALLFSGSVSAFAAEGYGGSGGGSSGGSSGGGGGAGPGCTAGLAAPAEGFSVRVNAQGPVFDRNVQLILNGGNATRMAISNDPGFVGASIEGYSANKTWTLTEGEGVKSVYVRFYDNCGFPTNMVQATVEFRASRPQGSENGNGNDNGANEEEGQVLGERIELVDELIDEVRFGQRSPRVRVLQTELVRLGYMPRGWRVTDFYGTVTRDAVNRYIAQRDVAPAVADAEIDGLIARLSFGQRGADVTRLQDLLKARGLFPQSVRSTGFYWSVTRNAVRRYQASINRAS